MARVRKRLLIVDGYNAIRSGSRYKRIDHPDHINEPFNAARDKLINDVIEYAGSDMDAVVVFDAAEGSHESATTEKRGHIKIVFSPIGQSADRIIEKLAFDARENNIETVVVTSDATIQDTVFGGCVSRMSAEGFSRAMNLDLADTHEEVSEYSKNTVASRVPSDILVKLQNLRDDLT